MVLASTALLRYNKTVINPYLLFTERISSPYEFKYEKENKIMETLFRYRYCSSAACRNSRRNSLCEIYEPGKRSADLGRLQQESYQGVFCSMYAPEAFPEDIYSTYMGYDAVSCSHRLTSFSDISDYLETAFPPEMRSLTYCSFWTPSCCGTAISIITVDFMPLSMRIFWHMSILIPVLNLP